MKAPQHVIDVVLAAIGPVTRKRPMAGRGLIVSDRSPSFGRLSTGITDRKSLCEFLDGTPSDHADREAVDDLLASADLVPVLFNVEGFEGCFAYRLPRSLS